LKLAKYEKILTKKFFSTTHSVCVKTVQISYPRDHLLLYPECSGQTEVCP